MLQDDSAWGDDPMGTGCGVCEHMCLLSITYWQETVRAFREAGGVLRGNKNKPNFVSAEVVDACDRGLPVHKIQSQWQAIPWDIALAQVVSRIITTPSMGAVNWFVPCTEPQPQDTHETIILVLFLLSRRAEWGGDWRSLVIAHDTSAVSAPSADILLPSTYADAVNYCGALQRLSSQEPPQASLFVAM